MRVANEERIPMIAVNVRNPQTVRLPPELNGISVINWTWDGIAAFLRRL
jgi:hypothetical protein